LGTETLAAQRISFNALSLSFLPGMGFGIAATALVGQSVGARRIGEGAAAARIATRWAIGWMGALAVVFLIFAPQIMRLFTDEPAMIRIGAAGLRVIALAQPFWAILMVQSGAMRGTGNTRFPLIVNATSMWSAVVIATVLVNTLGGGLGTVWSAFLVTAPISATLLWWYFSRTVSEIESGAT
jgi:Na+-driven multidrug efflux pump